MENDPEEMDMPCQCSCGNWFEHRRGFTSNIRKQWGYELICEECYEKQEAEE